MKNALSWFEISTARLNQAQAIFEAVVQRTVRREAMVLTQKSRCSRIREGFHIG